MGLVIGALAGYDLKGILQLAVKRSGDAGNAPGDQTDYGWLTPIAKRARKRLQAKFGDQEFLIGLDPRRCCSVATSVSASLIFSR